MAVTFMRLFALARHPTRCVRIALAVLLLAFAADTIAHQTHTHDAKQTQGHAAACGLCVAFNHLSDAPAHLVLPNTLIVPNAVLSAAPLSLPVFPIILAAQPRAPPVLLI
jgi:hypothetical protein